MGFFFSHLVIKMKHFIPLFYCSLFLSHTHIVCTSVPCSFFTVWDWVFNLVLWSVLCAHGWLLPNIALGEVTTSSLTANCCRVRCLMPWLLPSITCHHLSPCLSLFTLLTYTLKTPVCSRGVMLNSYWHVCVPLFIYFHNIFVCLCLFNLPFFTWNTARLQEKHTFNWSYSPTWAPILHLFSLLIPLPVAFSIYWSNVYHKM